MSTGLRIVVTGASGFIGAHLTSELSRRGHTVVRVSRRPLPGVHRVDDYRNSPDGDVLVHLAEDSDRASVNAKGADYKDEAIGVVQALTSTIRQRCIYASSGLVYGDKHPTPCTVEMPVAASDTYTETKLANEQLVLSSGGAVVRLSNLFGPGMAANNVVSDILRQVPGHGPVRVRDDKPVRDFLPVSEAATALARLIESEHRGILNVGSGRATSIRMLAQSALAWAGDESREIVATNPSETSSVNVLDISQTMAALAWAPSTGGLREQLGSLVQERVRTASG